MRRSSLISLVVLALFGVFFTQKAQACSRAFYVSADKKYILTGRNVDWFEDFKPSLWVFPRGVKRDGAANKNSLKWTSKYGSVITASYELGVQDGLNEKGLAVNLLYLAEADFGKRDVNRPGLSCVGFSQYLLDNFATVSEAVKFMKNSNIQMVEIAIPGSTNKPSSVHFSISDTKGDSAIFEYLKGKLVIHHSKDYKVMTNSPVYSQQIAIDAYWKEIDGNVMLPGTRRAADRFVRASYYLTKLPAPKSTRQAVAGVASVMRNVASPVGKADPHAPNIATTLWQSISDQIEKKYYYTSTFSTNTIWVDLKKFDLKEGTSTKMLNLSGDDSFSLMGDVSHKFIDKKPFKFAKEVSK